jgi:ribosomal-protein-alanine N-acetyltransferase
MRATEPGVPKLNSERLLLRPFRLDDASEVQRLAGNPKIAATTATIPHPYLDGMAEEWISIHGERFATGIAVDWAIELKTKKNLIGCVSLSISRAHRHAEIGYWIAEDYWNQGYCTEAATEAIRYAFSDLNLNKIVARHMAENPSSGQVMRKVGMQKEGVLRQDFFRQGKFVDMAIYGLLRTEFKL